MNNVIEKFEESTNSHIHASLSLETNSYGARFDAGFADQIIGMTKGKLNKGIPMILDYTNGIDHDPERVLVTKANFKKYFDNTYSYDQLEADYLIMKKDLVKESVHKAESSTTASETIANVVKGDAEIREIIIDFFSTNKLGAKYTKADDEFVFHRLRKDDQNNLYMLLGDNQLYRLEIKPNTERTLLGNTLEVNSQFWPTFFKTFEKDFKRWNDIILEKIQEYDFEECEKSIESVLLESGVPRIYLECHKLHLTLKGVQTDKKTIWVFHNCGIVLNNREAKAYTYNNLVKTLSENLIQAVDIGRVETIKNYSNDPNEIAIKHIYSPVPRTSKEPPKLPPAWEKFFGNGRFYDPIMDKMKIACFVMNILNANYSGRQILVIGGEGEDGKGVFLDVLGKLIGLEYIASLNSSAFAIDNEFGLENCINKKLIYLSDCKSVSKLFGEDKFKAMSGGDVISVNRKFMKALNWKPQGLCIAIATNNNFYINAEHGRSRAVPVVFRKNFTAKNIIDKHEMTVMLLSEKDEFIQWCADYRKWLNDYISKGNLLRGNTLMLCNDEDFKNVVCRKDDYDDFELFKNMCEKQTLNGIKFCNWNERSETEETTFDACFSILDTIFNEDILNAEYGVNRFSQYKIGEKYMKSVDVLFAINSVITSSEQLTKQIDSLDVGFKKDRGFSYNTKAFAEWVKLRFNVYKMIRIDGKQYKTLLDINSFTQKKYNDDPDFFA